MKKSIIDSGLLYAWFLSLLIVFFVSIISDFSDYFKVLLWLLLLLLSIGIVVYFKWGYYYYIIISVYCISFLDYNSAWFSNVTGVFINAILLFPVIIAFIFVIYKALCGGIKKMKMFDYLLIGYHMLSFLSIIYAGFTSGHFAFFIVHSIMYIALLFLIKSKKIDYDGVLYSLYIAVSLINSISLLLFISGSSALYSYDFGLNETRMFGLWGSVNPNRYAFMNVVGLSLSVYYIIKRFSVIVLINIILFVASQLYLYSRMGLILMVFSSLFVYVFVTRYHFNKYILMSFLALFVFFSINDIMILLSRGDDMAFLTFNSRSIIWDNLVRLIFDDIWHSVIGYGVTDNLLLLKMPFPVSHAHNGYLEIIISTGFIGIAFFLLYCFVLLFRLYEKYAYNQQSDYYIVLFIIIISLMIGGFSEPLFSGPYCTSVFIFQFIVAFSGVDEHDFKS